MSGKNFFEKQLETSKTLASNFSTSAVDVKRVDNCGFNIECTSVTDNTGAFYVDHRFYKDGNNFSAWAELTLSTTPTLANADDVFLINLNQLPQGQIRLRFVAAGGTPDGSCNVWVCGKEL